MSCSQSAEQCIEAARPDIVYLHASKVAEQFTEVAGPIAVVFMLNTWQSIASWPMALHINRFHTLSSAEQRIKASENGFAADVQSTRIFLRKTIHVNQTYVIPPFSEFSRLDFHLGQLRDQSDGSGKRCGASSKKIGSMFVCRSGPVVNNVFLETN